MIIKLNEAVANEAWMNIRHQLNTAGEPDWDDVNKLNEAIEGMSPIEFEKWLDRKTGNF
jgi:hypothetical protein